MAIMARQSVGIVKLQTEGMQQHNIISALCTLMVAAFPKTMHKRAYGSVRLQSKD